ncbi:hypothetical protein [Methylobacterium sp. WSM2598]|uniref:hypothetical protein n=1 Tax=Methylobacterium sp. WSM2598 TaxID=398261 RepID=UPI000367AE50|nr:hypothetical protein [Methylobacterium sp. WSM2598]
MAYGKNKQQERDTAPALFAFQVTERGEKKFWTRIGAAWEHEDGDGLTLQLDSIPLTGRIVLRTPKAEDEQQG